ARRLDDADDAKRVVGVYRHGLTLAQCVAHGGVVVLIATGQALDGGHDGEAVNLGRERSPSFARLAPILRVAWSQPGDQLRFLRIEAVLLVDADRADDTHAWASDARDDAHPQMRHLAAREPQRHEAVVIRLRARSPMRLLSIDGIGPAEELERLVNQVRAEVEEQPTRQRWIGALPPGVGLRSRAEALEAALEACDASECVALHQAPHGEEVIVPAAILEDAKRLPGALGRRDHLLRLGGAGCEWLIDHDG